jgi:hypothetical protein
VRIRGSGGVSTEHLGLRHFGDRSCVANRSLTCGTECSGPGVTRENGAWLALLGRVQVVLHVCLFEEDKSFSFYLSNRFLLASQVLSSTPHESEFLRS